MAEDTSPQPPPSRAPIKILEIAADAFWNRILDGFPMNFRLNELGWHADLLGGKHEAFSVPAGDTLRPKVQ
jgi:hypothetical protein